MENDLFNGPAVADQLKRDSEAMRRAIYDSDSLASESVQSIVERYQHSELVLHAADATFTSEATDAAVTITIEIPFEGSGWRLRCRPEGYRLGSQEVPEGEITRPTPAWARDVDGASTPTVRATRRFAPGTTAQQVKGWGRQYVQAVESWASLNVQAFAEHNRRIALDAPQLAKQRQAALDTQAELQEGLADGL